MKGIILAGGSGTRLHPITKSTSKQLIPLYNKPMVYYPMSTLMLAGIGDILVISTPQDIDNFKRLLGDGSDYGVNISYAVQSSPDGLAQAFIIANDCGFLDYGEPCALVLGDNIFHCPGFSELLKDSAKDSHSMKLMGLLDGSKVLNEFKKDDYDKENITIKDNGEIEWLYKGNATVFGYYVNDPERYGVAEFDENGNCISIEEKPETPKSNYAVVGLYFYPGDVIKKAREIKPSARGELEITTLNQMYLKENRLKVKKLQRGSAWFDTGTFDSLAEASNYVQTIEKRQGLKIACLEEIAYNNGWITDERLEEIGKSMQKNEYGQYLLKLIENK